MQTARRRARSPSAAHDAIDRFEPPQKLYGRGAETRRLLASFERVARGGVETVTGRGPARHRQDVARAGDLSADHAPARLLRRRQVRSSCSRTSPSARSSRRLQDLVQQLLTEERGSDRGVARGDPRRRAPERPADRRRRAGARAHHRSAAARAGARGVRGAEPLQSRRSRTSCRCSARRSHPLVLFLDDMQWADAASLNLVTLIVSARATESLLLVLTYRDNEVARHASVHARRQGAGEAGRAGAVDRACAARRPRGRGVRRRHAAPGRRDGEPLAEIIQQKTGGNPFFMRQFLQALHGAQLITFDARDEAVPLRHRGRQERRDHGERRRAARRRSCSKLPARTRERAARRGRDRRPLRPALARERASSSSAADDDRAACGAADRRRAHRAADGPRERRPGRAAIAARLRAVRVPARPRAAGRVRDACPRRERPALHLAIGRACARRHAPAASSRRRLFDIVGHLNQGRALIERRRASGSGSPS